MNGTSVNGYVLSKHEDLVAVVLKAYNANHPEEFNGVVTKTDQGDGSWRVDILSDEVVKLVDKAVSEYTAKLKEFDPELARVVGRETGTLFVLDAGDAFWNWFKESFAVVK